MAPNRKYANYPGARKGPTQVNTNIQKEDQNPVLRGWPLVAGSTILANSGAVQRFFWSNAKFGSIRDLPGLDDYRYRFAPDVICLSETGSHPDPIPFSAEVTTPAPADQPARYLSSADYHALYKTGAVTPLDVVQALLPLIRRAEGHPPPQTGPYANAWVASHGREDLAIDAARASTERWRRGEPLGPLDGVPIGVKDDIDVKGYVSHNGMQYRPDLPWFKPAEKTWWPVEQLEAAGAIVLGKNAMHELGGDTNGCNPRWGTPTNWHNKSYYPGGSSSGGGSALGAGIVPISIGTDAGGSIRIPSSFNGIYGLKPSHHRTCAMNSSMCVVGPLAATVSDLTIAYRLMSRPNPNDPIQGLYTPSIPPSPSAPKTIAIDEAWWSKASGPVASICRAAVDNFKSQGYSVVDIRIPYLREIQLMHSATCVTEMQDLARHRHPDPAAWQSIINHANKVTMSVGTQTPAGDYMKYNQLRDLLMKHLAHLFEENPGMLVVTPTTPLPGWPKHPGDEAYGVSDTNTTIANMSYVYVANVSGCPAVTAPVGYVDPVQGEGKIPVGLMAMAEWGCEEQLLGWAREAETYLHKEGRQRPEGWVDVIEMTKNGGLEAKKNI
ncbi:Fatty acid amide hydrolase [Colletotrichum sp. SAR 10_99]|nr:Fatty acid amide hydrolase [Colletotrichum sp. SAR 10_96]KAI8279362.1 Fatty acid amide hydrolase [Colletotrichum sp. SAR 10_98]KAJ5005486.1 Fatty acid amide hydrolase [Colletotrichum sp. SAR 10_99]